ncbi:MAG: hypothetical protein H0W68_06015 [Gemmatimonadaceae bacterium]|nr:hypothetical protein [Gemmatimonadaceae bacterium]
MSVGEADAISETAWKIAASLSAGCRLTNSAIARSYATTRDHWSVCSKSSYNRATASM